MKRTLRFVGLALLGPGLLLVGTLWVLLWFIFPVGAGIVGAATLLGIVWLADAGNRAVAQRQADALATAVARLNREA